MIFQIKNTEKLLKNTEKLNQKNIQKFGFNENEIKKKRFIIQHGQD